MARMGKLIDLSKCIGCRACQVACKQWNQLPAQIEGFTGSYQTHQDTLTQTYTIVKMQETEDGDRIQWHFRKHQCMHCGEATCIRICPHKARKQMAEGAVYQQAGCRGCAYCAAKCPFQIPKVDQRQKRSYSCWLCYDRITNGLKPAFVTVCPTGALSFGVRDDLVAQSHARLAEVQVRYPEANLYGLNFLGGTGVIYLLLKDPGFYGLPLNPAVPPVDTWYGSANGVLNCTACHGAAIVTYPWEGQTVAGIISVTAYAEAKAGITKVEFYLDGTLVATDTTSPFSFQLDTTKYADGPHKIKAKAYSSGGGIKTRETSFFIANPGTVPPEEPNPSPDPADLTPPIVSITSPKEGATVKGTVTVKVKATDDTGVALVELYVQDVLAATKRAAPYDFALDTRQYANGVAILRAIAYDPAGNRASAERSVKISN